MGRAIVKPPVHFQDFRPLYVKDGKLWVPYMACDKWRLGYMDLATAWKCASLAMPVLGNSGEIIPFALAKLRRFGGDGH